MQRHDTRVYKVIGKEALKIVGVKIVYLCNVCLIRKIMK